MRTALALPVILVPALAHAGGFRCEDRLVSIGASKAEVLARCGEPLHVGTELTSQTVRRLQPGLGYVERQITVEIERWTYFLSINRLIRTAIFEDGRLRTVRTEGKAPTRPASLELCGRAVHTVGDSIGEILLRCGPPDDSHEWQEDVAAGTVYQELRTAIPYTRWTYNLGPQRFMRIFTFRRDRLIKEATGPRGWAIQPAPEPDVPAPPLLDTP